MKRSGYRQCLKGGCFILFFLIALKMLVMLLYPSNFNTRVWYRFYKLERESVDMLVVGNSHAYSTFDPAIVLEKTGMNSYNLTSNSQMAAQSYYNVKEALHYQSPKILIMEALALDNNYYWRFGNTPDRDWKKESNLDGMRFGLTKLEAVREQYLPENWGYALFSIARYHNNWENMVTVGSNLAFYLGGFREFSSFRPSFSSMSEATQKIYAETSYNPAEWAISWVNRDHFKKLAKLCREKGIQFYLVMAPMYDDYVRSINYESRADQIAALAESEGVPYLDCNRYYEEIGLTAEDFEDIWSDYHHLNGEGAKKVTRFVMEKLCGQEGK